MRTAKWDRLPASHPKRDRLPACHSLPPNRRPSHTGFSLLEVILATAILAASSMVLLSLLGLGTKYGNRAEERSLVASQAQSLLDEFLVSASTNASGDESQLEEEQERTGVLPGIPSHAYRLVSQPYEPSALAAGSNRLSLSADNSSPTTKSGLTMVTIQVFDSAELNTDNAPLLLELTQLVRSSLLAPRSASIGGPVHDPFQLLD